MTEHWHNEHPEYAAYLAQRQEEVYRQFAAEKLEPNQNSTQLSSLREKLDFALGLGIVATSCVLAIPVLAEWAGQEIFAKVSPGYRKHREEMIEREVARIQKSLS